MSQIALRVRFLMQALILMTAVKLNRYYNSGKDE